VSLKVAVGVVWDGGAVEAVYPGTIPRVRHARFDHSVHAPCWLSASARS